MNKIIMKLYILPLILALIMANMPITAHASLADILGSAWANSGNNYSPGTPSYEARNNPPAPAPQPSYSSSGGSSNSGNSGSSGSTTTPVIVGQSTSDIIAKAKTDWAAANAKIPPDSTTMAIAHAQADAARAAEAKGATTVTSTELYANTVNNLKQSWYTADTAKNTTEAATLHDAAETLRKQQDSSYKGSTDGSSDKTMAAINQSKASDYNTLVAEYERLKIIAETGSDSEKKFAYEQAKALGLTATLDAAVGVFKDVKGNIISSKPDPSLLAENQKDNNFKDGQYRYLGKDSSGNLITNPSFPDEASQLEWQNEVWFAVDDIIGKKEARALTGIYMKSGDYTEIEQKRIAQKFLENNPEWSSKSVDYIVTHFVMQEAGNGLATLRSVHMRDDGGLYYKTFGVDTTSLTIEPPSYTIKPPSPDGTTPAPVTGQNNPSNNPFGGGSSGEGLIRFIPESCEWRNSDISVKAVIQGDIISSAINVFGAMLGSYVSVPNGGSVILSKEGIGYLHGEAVNDTSYVGNSGLYKIDKTVPTINFDWSNQDGVDASTHEFIFLPDNNIKLSLGDNLSGVSQSKYLWSKDAAFPDILTMSEIGISTIEGASENKNTQISVHDSDSLRVKRWYLHVYVRDRAGNETKATVDVNIKSTLQDFNITDVKDPNWKSVFKDSNGNTNGSFYSVSHMPVDNHPSLSNAICKKGYAFYFSIISKGLNLDADSIVITPKFYHMSDLNGTNRQEVDMYYNLNDKYLVKVGSSRDTSIIDHKGSSIGGFNGLILTKPQRTIADTKTAKWEGNYFLMSSSIPVIKGTAPEKESNQLKGGYILVQFQLEAYKGNVQMFSYVPTQWQVDGGPKRASNIVGDTFVFDNSHSALDDYSAGNDR